MKNKRITLIAVALIAFFLGGLAGYGLAFKQFHVPPAFLRTMLLLAAQGNLTAMQYLNAGYKEAKESLVRFINLLDDLKASGEIADKNLNLNDYYLDRGLSFARLALLEEKAGNHPETATNMEEAVKMFQAAGWKDISEDKVRFLVNRLDKLWQPQKGNEQK